MQNTHCITFTTWTLFFDFSDNSLYALTKPSQTATSCNNQPHLDKDHIAKETSHLLNLWSFHVHQSWVTFCHYHWLSPFQMTFKRGLQLSFLQKKWKDVRDKIFSSGNWSLARNNEVLWVWDESNQSVWMTFTLGSKSDVLEDGRICIQHGTNFIWFLDTFILFQARLAKREHFQSDRIENFSMFYITFLDFKGTSRKSKHIGKFCFQWSNEYLQCVKVIHQYTGHSFPMDWTLGFISLL